MRGRQIAERRRLTGEDIGYVSEVLLPRGALDRLGMPCGVIERPRHTGPGGSTSKPTGRPKVVLLARGPGAPDILSWT
jgi:hypothetical protein